MNCMSITDIHKFKENLKYPDEINEIWKIFIEPKIILSIYNDFDGITINKDKYQNFPEYVYVCPQYNISINDNLADKLIKFGKNLGFEVFDIGSELIISW